MASHPYRLTARLLGAVLGATVFLLQHIPFAQAQPAVYQTIRGQVVEHSTGLPIPGAHVVVLHTDPILGTTTKADGWFALDRVPLGRHDLLIRFLGYEPMILPQQLVTAGKETVVLAALREQVLQGGEVVVMPEVRKDQTQNDLGFVSARAFSVEETRRYAGGLDDPARMASAFAGVTTGGGLQDNALVIRGNAPKGVLWRLEGVEIPNPNHFAGLSVAGGGGLTLFSSQLLAESDFFTGAFPAEYGNALAGVFDMHFRTGNRARRSHTVQAGLLGLEGASEGPFVRGKPATYLFNYRYSTLGLLLPLLPTEDLATYQDLSFKLNFPTRHAGRFQVWGVGGLDAQAMAATPDSTQWAYETWDRLDADLALATGAAGLTHDLVLGPRTALHTAAAATLQRTVLDQQRLADNLVLRPHLSIHSTTGRLVLSAYLNHQAHPGHTHRTGFAVQWLSYRLQMAAAPTPGAAPVPLVWERGTSALLQFYSQSKLDLSPRLALHAGAHLQHLALTGRTSVEPRAGLRWAFQGGQALSLGYGLHSQIEDLRLYLVRPSNSTSTPLPNRTLDVAKAHHLVLSYDRPLGQKARLKLETYFQSLFDVPVIPDSTYSLLNFEQDFTFREALVNEGAGQNYGAELTLERFLGDGYYYLLTTALFQSRYRAGDGVWRATRFDRRYAANALFGKEVTVGGDDLLGLNGRLILMGGKRRTPVDIAASLAQETVVYDEKKPFTLSDPPLVVLDLTLTYRRNHTRTAAVWALQIKNLLAAQEAIPDYNYATQQVDDVREGFPLPVLSYALEF